MKEDIYAKHSLARKISVLWLYGQTEDSTKDPNCRVVPQTAENGSIER